MSEATSGPIDIQQMLESTVDYMETFENLFHGDAQLPYEKFTKLIEFLESECDLLSHATGTLAGEIKTLTETAKSNYCISVQNIDAWCGKASDLLNAYINLCGESTGFFARLSTYFWKSDRYDEETVQTQRDLLMKVLSDGMQEMSKALMAFEKSVDSLDQVSGKLIELESALGQDKNKNKNIWKNLKEGFGGVKGAIKLSIGVILSIRAGLSFALLAMAATSLCTSFEIYLRLNNLHTKFKTLAENVRNSKAEIDHVKKMCMEEMKIIGELNASTDSTNYLLKNRLYQKEAICAVKKLITLCKNYREKNREKF